MNKKLEVKLNLDDIEEYVNSALFYFDNEGNPNFDKDEMIMYLSTIPEKVDDTKKLLIEIENNYENEIKLWKERG